MNADRSDSESAALRQTLAELHREAWTWALACCDRNRVDAEDVLQTTYLKILDGRARFDGRSSRLTWLFAVIRRTAADLRRRRFLRDLFFVPADSEPAGFDAVPPIDDQVEQAQTQRALIGALRSLSRRQREVLTLVFYHELTVEQAAQIVDISVGSARQHYARGKATLRARLDAIGVGR